MNDTKRERPFSNSRTASSLLTPPNSNQHGDTTEQFMRTSFYLPTDVLQNKEWVVYPIIVIAGSTFWINYDSEMKELHCLEDYDLLCKAQWVGISERVRKSDNKMFSVAKIWYKGDAR